MNSENGWFSLVKICDKTVKFKLDTGAEANIIPKSLYNKLNDVSLRSMTTQLTTFPNTTIMSIGKTLTVNCQLLKVNGKQQDLDFYVMNFNSMPLLGLKACQSLALVSKIESIENAEEMNITIHSLIHNPSMKDDCIMKIHETTERDEILKLLKKIVYDGWPHHKRSLPQTLSWS